MSPQSWCHWINLQWTYQRICYIWHLVSLKAHKTFGDGSQKLVANASESPGPGLRLLHPDVIEDGEQSVIGTTVVFPIPFKANGSIFIKYRPRWYRWLRYRPSFSSLGWTGQPSGGLPGGPLLIGWFPLAGTKAPLAFLVTGRCIGSLGRPPQWCICVLRDIVFTLPLLELAGEVIPSGWGGNQGHEHHFSSWK